MSERSKRKVLMINPRFQLSFLAYSAGMGAVIIGIFYAANSYFFWKFLNKGKEAGLPPDHIFFKFLREQASTMDYIFLATAIFATGFIISYCFYLSHRVAGAMYHLETHFRNMSKTGKIHEIRFRKSDYFHEVAEAMNEFIRHKKDEEKS